MLRSGLRRVLVALAVLVALTSGLSLAIGALAHANLARALADGFYLAGAVVLIGSFISGLRGPLRSEWKEGREGEMPVPAGGGGILGPGGLVPRGIRRTTLDERADARRNSIALFMLGLALILIGAGFDPSRNAF